MNTKDLLKQAYVQIEMEKQGLAQLARLGKSVAKPVGNFLNNTGYGRVLKEDLKSPLTWAFGAIPVGSALMPSGTMDKVMSSTVGRSLSDKNWFEKLNLALKSVLSSPTNLHK
jgi:hypothetical protein